MNNDDLRERLRLADPAGALSANGDSVGPDGRALLADILERPASISPLAWGAGPGGKTVADIADEASSGTGADIIPLEHSARSRRIRIGWLVSAAAAAVLVAAGLSMARTGQRVRTNAPPVGPQTTASIPTTVASGPLAPATTAAPPNTTVAALTSTTAIGSVGSGAAWHDLPPSPLQSRSSFASAWTGSELLFWGGMGASSGLTGPAQLADGAVYDPTARAWRLLPAAPTRLRGAVMASAWTGTELLVVTGAMNADPMAAAAYDPAKRSWRDLGLDTMANEGVGSVWTGKQLVIFGGHGGQANSAAMLVYTLANSRWQFVEVPDFVPAMSASGVWTGSEIVITGTRAACPEVIADPRCAVYSPSTVAFTPTTGAWRVLPMRAIDNDPTKAAPPTSLAWFGGRVVAAVQVDGRARIVTLDSKDTGWKAVPETDGTMCPSADQVPPALVATVSVLALVCPNGAAFVSADGRTWTSRSAAASDWPLVGPTMVAVNDRVVAWDGSLGKELSVAALIGPGTLAPTVTVLAPT